MDSDENHSSEGLALLDIGVAVFDRSARLVFCNDAFRALRRYPEKICRAGVTLEALLRFNAERGDFGPGEADVQVAERLQEIERAQERTIEREMVDGQVLRIRYRHTPSGGLLVTFEDRTEERRAQAALAASEERYSLVAEAAEEAIYEWEIESGRFYASPRLKALIGREWGEGGARPWGWEEIIHPDDRASYRDHLERHISGEDKRWECEYRIEDANGAFRWVSDHGTSIRDEDGRAIRMVAAIRDVTDRVERDAALAKSEERHALVTQATSDGIYDWNVTEDVLYVSDNLTRMLDFNLDIKASRMWAQQVHSDDYQRYADATRAHLKGQTEAIDCEYRVRAKGGGYRWVHDRGVGVRGPDGRVTRLVGAVRDITEMKEARAEIERTEAQLISSLATISDGILLVDGDNRVQLWNDRYYEIFSDAAGGADLSEVMVKGRPFFEMIRDGYQLGMFKPHPNGVDGWVAARKRAWDEPVSQWELELANGTWILLNERAMPDGGRVSVYTDITELKRREQEAQAARQRFEDAIESISSGFALFDADDRLVIWNSRFRDYFAQMADVFTPGRTFREMLAASVERGLFPAAEGDKDAFLDDLLLKRAEGIGKVRENRISDGLWLQIRDHRTSDGGLVSVYTDVTELKTSEQEARAARERFEEAIEAIASGFALWDAEDCLMACNSRFRSYFEELADKVVPGVRFCDLILAGIERGMFADEDDPEAVLRKIMTARSKTSGEPRERHLASGLWLHITDHRTREGGIVSIYTDVTELKAREQEAQAARQRFEDAIEAISSGFTLWDADDRLVISNSKYREYYKDLTDVMVQPGTSFEEVLRTAVERGLVPAARDDPDGYVRRNLKTRVTAKGELREHRLADGRVLQISDHRTADGGIATIHTDVTELVKKQAEIEAQSAILKATLENMGQGITMVDKDLKTVAFNRKFFELLDFPEDRFGGGFTMEEAFRYNAERGEYGPGEVEEQVCERLELAAKFLPHKFERTRHDGTVIEIVGNPIEGGGLVATYTDITERKRNEAEILKAKETAEVALADLQKAQARLVQAEKMASLGQLTAGIAHEIKNPLNFVNNFSRLSDELLVELMEILQAPIKALDPDARDDAEDLLATVRENLGKISQHGKRADSIVKNMLAHSREGPSEQRTVSLNPIAEEALNLAYHGARAEHPGFNIEMKKALDPETGEIECFPQDLMRVFLNLISNGMYAANKRQEETGGAPPEIAISTRAKGDRVEIEVRDNGTGIPPGLREEIFLPFFTTKPTGEGTGLGLSLSYDIVVKQHGGELTVDSEPGDFTAFRVTLPRTLPANVGRRP